MSAPKQRRPWVLMIAYTHYESDPRVMRAAEAAIEAGYRVDFLAVGQNRSGGVECLRGVRLHRIARRKHRGAGVVGYVSAYVDFFVRCWWKSTQLSLRKRYEIVHVNNMPDFLVFSVALPKILGARVILDIHDSMPDTFASKFGPGRRRFFEPLLRWEQRLSAAFADRVITVHLPMRDQVLAKHGLRQQEIGVISNFPDLDLFRYRSRYEPDIPLQLLFHGTILERSGLGMLVAAFAAARERDRLRLTIIGDGDFSGELTRLIAEHGVAESVAFHNTRYPVREIPVRIAAADVGVVPLDISSSTNQALPLKLLEYVAVGLPVIAVRSAGILHYFTEADCIFFDSGNVSELSAILDRIARQPEMLKPYHQRAAGLRERYSWASEKRSYQALLHEMAAARAPARMKRPGGFANRSAKSRATSPGRP